MLSAALAALCCPAVAAGPGIAPGCRPRPAAPEPPSSSPCAGRRSVSSLSTDLHTFFAIDCCGYTTGTPCGTPQAAGAAFDSPRCSPRESQQSRRPPQDEGPRPRTGPQTSASQGVVWPLPPWEQPALAPLPAPARRPTLHRLSRRACRARLASTRPCAPTPAAGRALGAPERTLLAARTPGCCVARWRHDASARRCSPTSPAAPETLRGQSTHARGVDKCERSKITCRVPE